MLRLLVLALVVVVAWWFLRGLYAEVVGGFREVFAWMFPDY